jgi:hypothetical protein|eukprot:jgi/Chrpa1/10933/Chrysochromulina_OHIO_Genome00013304-RA
MQSLSAADTSESAAEPVFKSARREGRHPDHHIAICTVDKPPYVGMELDVYETPETNLDASRISFYMHKDSREKFPMVEHTQAPRTADGIAIAPSIRLRERLLHEGNLRCATCPRLPSIGHGTLHFIIDSTTEEAPSSTTLKRHGFLEEKIKDGKAQILCRDCELTKTFQGSPGNKGTCRPRRSLGDLVDDLI